MMNTLGALRQAMWANSIPAVAHPTDLDDGLRVLAQRIHEDLQHRLEDYDPGDVHFEVAVTEFPPEGGGAWLRLASAGGPLGGYSLATYLK